jgi:hypothetical protein
VKGLDGIRLECTSSSPCVPTASTDQTNHPQSAVTHLKLLRRDPDDVQKRAVLAMVVKALACLHGAGTAHCALGPGSVLWYARDNAMKLGELGCAAEPGQATRVSPVLRYAPPEVLPLELCAHDLVLCPLCLGN